MVHSCQRPDACREHLGRLRTADWPREEVPESRRHAHEEPDRRLADERPLYVCFGTSNRYLRKRGSLLEWVQSRKLQRECPLERKLEQLLQGTAGVQHYGLLRSRISRRQ